MAVIWLASVLSNACETVIESCIARQYACAVGEQALESGVSNPGLVLDRIRRHKCGSLNFRLLTLK